MVYVRFKNNIDTKNKVDCINKNKNLKSLYTTAEIKENCLFKLENSNSNMNFKATYDNLIKDDNIVSVYPIYLYNNCNRINTKRQTRHSYQST